MPIMMWRYRKIWSVDLLCYFFLFFWFPKTDFAKCMLRKNLSQTINQDKKRLSKAEIKIKVTWNWKRYIELHLLEMKESWPLHCNYNENMILRIRAFHKHRLCGWIHIIIFLNHFIIITLISYLKIAIQKIEIENYRNSIIILISHSILGHWKIFLSEMRYN